MSHTREIFHASVFTPGPGGFWGLPMLFEGDPGVGKSQVIKQYAENWGMHCEVLSPSLRGEGAFGVVPVPLNGYLTYPPPDYAKACDEAVGGAIIFVDEINTVGGQLQAAMLGLVDSRTVGSHRFGRRVRVLGAHNSTEVAANGFDLSAPLANRFGHTHWEVFSIEEHGAYMLGGATGATKKGDALKEEARVMKAWPEAWAEAVGLEIAFLQTHTGFKNMCPKSGDPSASKGWPSDRTWEYATRAYASALVHGLPDAAADEFVSSFVGRKAHEAFSAFVEHADMPKAADVLDGKVDFKWEKKRLDRCAAVVSSCAALVVPKEAEKREARSEVLWKIMGDATNFDITVPAAQALVKADLHLGKVARPILVRLYPVMRAAGLSAGVQL